MKGGLSGCREYELGLMILRRMEELKELHNPGEKRNEKRTCLNERS